MSGGCSGRGHPLQAPPCQRGRCLELVLRCSLLAVLAVAALPAAEATAGTASLSRVAADAEWETLRQHCAHASAQAVAIAIADAHPTPDHALLLYRELLERGDSSATLIALRGIAQLGPQARVLASTVDALLAATNGIPLRSAALATLLALQPTAPSEAAVASAVADDRLPPSSRADAARLLGAWGVAGPSTQTALTHAVDDNDSQLAGAAYAALVALAGAPATGHGPPDAAALVPGAPLPAQLRAVAALPQKSLTAAQCEAVLRIAQCDPRRGARAMAWTMLAALGGDDPACVAAEIQLLSTRDPFLQQLSSQALMGDPRHGVPGPSPQPTVVRVLAQALPGADAQQRRCLLAALAHVGPAGAGAAREVWAMLDHPLLSMEELSAGLGAVRAWGPAPRADQERLAALLPSSAALYGGRSHDQADAIQAMLLSTLAVVGVPPSARRGILAALASPDPRTPDAFAAAARAVLSEGPRGRYAVPYLLVALDAGFRDAAVDVDSLPSLLRRSHASSVETAAIPPQPPSARWYAIRALGAIGPAAAPALPALRAFLAQAAQGGNQALLCAEASAAIRSIQNR